VQEVGDAPAGAGTGNVTPVGYNAGISVTINGRDPFTRWEQANVVRGNAKGTVSAGAYAKLGDITSEQFRALAAIQREFNASVRLTNRQNVAFRDLTEEQIPALYERLAAIGMAEPGAELARDVVSCPGAESCRLAVTQSRGLGRLLTEHLSARPDLVDMVPSGNIKISGCPNGCGQHHIASIGFQGSVRKVAGRQVPQYFVLVGGGCSDDGVAHFGKVVSKVPVHRLTTAVDRLMDLYKGQRQPDEDLGAFFRRIPPAAATDVLKDLALLLPNETTADDFIDLAETQAFSPEVMDGECSA
jgi:sulfite reductase beta subunit-like hemoprotein